MEYVVGSRSTRFVRVQAGRLREGRGVVLRLSGVLVLVSRAPPFLRAVARALARARSGTTVSWAGEPRIAREMAARSWSTSSCEGEAFRTWGSDRRAERQVCVERRRREDSARGTHLGEREVERGLRPPADRALRARCRLSLPPVARGLGRSQRLAVHPTRELRPEEAGGDVLRVEVVQEVHRGEGPRRTSTARSSLCCHLRPPRARDRNGGGANKYRAEASWTEQRLSRWKERRETSFVVQPLDYDP